MWVDKLDPRCCIVKWSRYRVSIFATAKTFPRARMTSEVLYYKTVELSKKEEEVEEEKPEHRLMVVAANPYRGLVYP